jgi:ribonucleoside-diphosphate reductase alpha chain
MKNVVEQKSPVRRRLPDERQSITHKFSISQHDGYLVVGLYEDGQPGEIFVVMSKEGSTISGLMDAFATAISLALQHGVPLQALCDKFKHATYEPSGVTQNPEIRFASSITDYVFKWLERKFLGETLPQVEEKPKEKAEFPYAKPESFPKSTGSLTIPGSGSVPVITKSEEWRPNTLPSAKADGPPCKDCGCMMVRSGACFKCMNCGGTSGCS